MKNEKDPERVGSVMGHVGEYEYGNISIRSREGDVTTQKEGWIWDWSVVTEGDGFLRTGHYKIDIVLLSNRHQYNNKGRRKVKQWQPRIYLHVASHGN